MFCLAPYSGVGCTSDLSQIWPESNVHRIPGFGPKSCLVVEKSEIPNFVVSLQGLSGICRKVPRSFASVGARSNDSDSTQMLISSIL